MKIKIKVCSICKNKFNTNTPGRLRIAKKVDGKGEEIRWVCVKCATRL